MCSLTNSASALLLFLLLRTCESSESPCKDKGVCESAFTAFPTTDPFPPFKLTVVILTMNRAHSLARLLRSLEATDFEFDSDGFDIEMHVDKSIGAHYDDCVE